VRSCRPENESKGSNEFCLVVTVVFRQAQHLAPVHRVAADTILWRQGAALPSTDGLVFRLLASQEAQLQFKHGTASGVDAYVHLELLPDGDQDEIVQAALNRFPHLRGCSAFRLQKTGNLATLITSQLAVVAETGTQVSQVTGVQLAGVLDDKCASSRTLQQTCCPAELWTVPQDASCNMPCCHIL
jgi:Pullulanase N2 domain